MEMDAEMTAILTAETIDNPKCECGKRSVRKDPDSCSWGINENEDDENKIKRFGNRWFYWNLCELCFHRESEACDESDLCGDKECPIKYLLKAQRRRQKRMEKLLMYYITE